MDDEPSGIRKLLIYIENAALALAGAILLAMGLVMASSILGKHLFLKPIPDDLLIVGILNIAVIALPLAYVERKRGHIKVTVTTDWMGPRALSILDAFGALAMAIFFGGIGFMVARKMPEEMARGAYYDGVLQIPVWPMKALFGAAILLFVIRLLFTIYDSLSDAIAGRHVDATNNMPEEV